MIPGPGALSIGLHKAEANPALGAEHLLGYSHRLLRHKPYQAAQVTKRIKATVRLRTIFQSTDNGNGDGSACPHGFLEIVLFDVFHAS